MKGKGKRKGKKKNSLNHDGWTPLHYAAQNGHFDQCKIILDNVKEKIPKIKMAVPHFTMLPSMVIWICADSLLRKLKTKILLELMDGHLFIVLLIEDILMSANSLLLMWMTKIQKLMMEKHQPH